MCEGCNWALLGRIGLSISEGSCSALAGWVVCGKGWCCFTGGVGSCVCQLYKAPQLFVERGGKSAQGKVWSETH